jgi:hypothetical protein
MAIWQKISGAAMAAIMVVGLAAGGTVTASPTGDAPRTQPSVMQTADSFLDIAYTWKASWFGTHYPSIGTRDVAYSSSRLDGILKNVIIGPETDANVTSWTPKGGRELSRRSLSDGTVALAVRLAVGVSDPGGSGTFRVTNHLHLKQVDGKWKVFGSRLPGAQGPSKWCVNSPAASAFCSIFPAGSN